MKRDQNALQQIKLELDLDTRDATIYSIRYPDDGTLDRDATALWICRSVPVLQELSMISRTLYMNSAARNTTSVSSHNLELQAADDPLIYNKAQLERYLNHLGQQSTFRVLVIY